MQTPSHDVVIVGGGAAGLSAALVLGRARRRIAVIDAGSPRSFTVHLGDGRSLSSRRILVATGAGDGIPDIAGVEERWGRDLLHCPYCHGWEVGDQPLGVIGSNSGSIQHAQLVRQWSDDVIYFAHTQEPSATEAAELTARGVRVVHGEIERLVVEEDRLTGVQLVTGEVVARQAVFVRPIIAPHPDHILAELGCELDDTGFAVVDSAGRTSVPGVWGAGNAVDPRAQVITAAGAGSAAAIDINNDLVQDDIALAIAGEFRQWNRSAPSPRPRPSTAGAAPATASAGSPASTASTDTYAATPERTAP